jgi:acyl-[acyl-carrier-protein] desaturase
VITPVLRHWRVFEREGFSPRAEKARDELAVFMADLDARATKMVEKRERMAARKAG